MRPFTFALTQRRPMSVCTAKAKSTVSNRPEALYVALGREDRLRPRRVDLKRLHQLLGSRISQPLHNLPEPGYLLPNSACPLLPSLASGLRFPARRRSAFHGCGSEFERLARRSDHRRVERLVHV